MKQDLRITIFGAAIAAVACCGAPANAIRAPRVELPSAIRAAIFRSTRALTREEVSAAIQRAAEQAEYAGMRDFGPENVLLQAQILVGPGDAGLEIVRADFDQSLKRGRFLLRALKEPAVLPFYAFVRFGEEFDPTEFPATTAGEDAPSRQRREASPLKAKPEILVAPNQSATLVLRSESLSMVTDVVALERGSMGQQVRVRELDTGKVFLARVDGRAHLDLKF